MDERQQNCRSINGKPGIVVKGMRHRILIRSRQLNHRLSDHEHDNTDHNACDKWCIETESTDMPCFIPFLLPHQTENQRSPPNRRYCLVPSETWAPAHREIHLPQQLYCRSVQQNMYPSDYRSVSPPYWVQAAETVSDMPLPVTISQIFRYSYCPRLPEIIVMIFIFHHCVICHKNGKKNTMHTIEDRE